jgi:hypothetical protein
MEASNGFSEGSADAVGVLAAGVGVLAGAAGVLEAGVELFEVPQATRVRNIASARSMLRNFFIYKSS